jgi:hypothetical protein
MLLTEDQAKQRWCPHARSVGYLNTSNTNTAIAGYNRDHPSGQIPACIASSCMAWRFNEPKQVRDLDLVTGDVVAEKPRLGYCGLSGKPEYE